MTAPGSTVTATGPAVLVTRTAAAAVRTVRVTATPRTVRLVVTRTQRPPAPTTDVAPAYYAKCSQARAAGAAPLYRGDAGYRSGLDRDGDGVACE
jgi:hypothetical protein